jgi:hypothetical protein
VLSSEILEASGSEFSKVMYTRLRPTAQSCHVLHFYANPADSTSHSRSQSIKNSLNVQTIIRKVQYHLRICSGRILCTNELEKAQSASLRL